MSDQVQITVKMRGVVWRDLETGLYGSHAPSVNVFSQGESEADATDGLAEAVEMYVKEHVSRGTLEHQLINEFGFIPAEDTNDFVSGVYAKEVPIFVHIDLANKPSPVAQPRGAPEEKTRDRVRPMRQTG